MAFVVGFPGQGIDHVDMARILREHATDPLVAELAATTGLDDFERIDLTDTLVAQPCIYTASVLAARSFAPTPGDAPEAVVAVCGHSFGELAALAWAGAMSATAGLRLVRRRAELSRDLAARAGTMIVVMRLDAGEVEWVRRSAEAATGGVLEWAVTNGPGQFVLSGDTAAAKDALVRVDAAGGVGRALPIGGAFHSPLLAAAVPPYEAALQAEIAAAPAVPIVSCTVHRPMTDPAEIALALARALVLPVDWPATLAAAVALGARRGLDVGPGRTLHNLAGFLDTVPFDALSPERRGARGRA